MSTPVPAICPQSVRLSDHTGGRQAGKSTLARIVARAHANAVIRLLDDPATLRSARDDPAGFVDHDGLMVIDEIQLAPELFRSIKVTVDTDPRPGQFLLTGSAQVLALRRLPDALPGGMEIVELWPFPQGELEHSPDTLIDAAFAHGPGLSRVSATLATASAIPRTTLNRYLELLSAVFLIKQIPAWAAGQSQRAIGTPKLAFADTGIAAHLLGQDTSRLGEPDGGSGTHDRNLRADGTRPPAHLVRGERPALSLPHQGQDRGGRPPGTPDGRVIAIEVKAGATVRSEDLAGLRHLRHRLGRRLIAGYVLYTGWQDMPAAE